MAGPYSKKKIDEVLYGRPQPSASTSVAKVAAMGLAGGFLLGGGYLAGEANLVPRFVSWTTEVPASVSLKTPSNAAPAYFAAPSAAAPSLPSPVPRNCAQARAMGLAMARRGEPGYAPHLDRDNDGVACEPLPRSRR